MTKVGVASKERLTSRCRQETKI